MDHEVIDQPGLAMVGISARITPEQAMQQIGELWGRFMSDGVLARIPGRLDEHAIIAAYTDYDSDHTGPYTLLLGTAVAPAVEPPQGMQRRSFEAQSSARITATGEVPGVVQRTWQAVYDSNLPRAFTVDYERYDVRSMGAQARLELRIALARS